MIHFDLKYYTELYNKNNPLRISSGTVLRPLYVKWNFEGRNFEFLRNDEDFIISMYVCQQFILVCYSEDSLHFQSPSNLVLYNLKKKIIKVIPPPVPKRGGNMSITSMGNIKMIDDEKYISVRIDDIINSWTGNVEIHYLNLDTLDYHPTIIETFFEYGR